MGKYRAPGASSSVRTLRSRKDVTANLAALCRGPHVTAIRSALGNGGSIHLVGGTVRDAFFGLPERDLDLATSLTPQDVVDRAKSAGLRTVETGIRHGTVLIVVDGTPIEITSFRRPSDREHFTSAGSIEEDLGGRDFTINALAFDVEGELLVDPYEGSTDLERGILRAVGTPDNRFDEDPLRVLRMIRFGPAAGFVIAEETRNAGKAVVPRLTSVSPERIRTELDHIIMGDTSPAFREMLALGILDIVLPELPPAVGVEQNEYHIHDVFDHTLWVLERCPPDRILRWAAVFHDVGKPGTVSVGEDGRRHFYKHEILSDEMCRPRLEALKFSKDDIDRICLIVRHHMRPTDCGPTGVRRLLRDLGPEFSRWFEFKYADAPPILSEEEVNRDLERFSEMVRQEEDRLQRTNARKLAIDGNDLIAIGMKPGKDLGAVLKALDEAVLEEPEINTRDILLERAKTLINRPH